MTVPVPETRDFHLSAILSITTDVFLAVNGLEDVHDLLAHMTGESLATHQWPRVAGECAPRLLEQHPALAEIVVPDWHDGVALGTVLGWLDEQTARYGETLPVSRMAVEDHTSIDPLTEFVAKWEATR